MAKINRLEQFILMLGSDQSGEVSAAAGMLVRQLQKEGKDLHWLVAQLHGKAEPVRSAPDPNALARAMAEIMRLKNRVKQAESNADQFQQRIHQLLAEIKQLKAPAPPSLDNLEQMVNNVLHGMYSQQYASQQDARTATAQKAYADQLNRQQNTYNTGGFGAWRQQVEWAMDYGRRHKLCDQREGNFLFEMSLKPEGFTPSYKQASWIDDIYQRLRRVEASKR